MLPRLERLSPCGRLASESSSDHGCPHRAQVSTASWIGTKRPASHTWHWDSREYSKEGAVPVPKSRAGCAGAAQHVVQRGVNRPLASAIDLFVSSNPFAAHAIQPGHQNISITGKFHAPDDTYSENLPHGGGRNACGIHADGTTIVMVTLDPDLAKRAERNIHLIDGRVSEEEFAHSQKELTGSQPMAA